MDWARMMQSAGVGRLAYRFYHRPLGLFRRSWRDGGPLERLRDWQGERAMLRAAAGLPPCNAKGRSPLTVHVLTGRRFWYQTAFCLWTFSRHSGRDLAPIFYDDGSLDASLRASLKRLFPAAHVVSRPESLARLDEHLPEARFPFLRERWQNYPNIRKLIDPHLAHAGWRLVVDSDLLFFRRPDFLLHWLDRPDRPLHAVDCTESYGYSSPLLQRLAGAPLPRNVNVGLCGLDGAALDWDRLEYWCRTLIQQEGTHYYLEQALIALLVAGRDCAVAPAGEYVTLPDEREAQTCSAVMHHYVAESKRWYFRQNWRRCLPLA